MSTENTENKRTPQWTSSKWAAIWFFAGIACSLASVPAFAWFDLDGFFICIILAFASFIAALRQAPQRPSSKWAAIWFFAGIACFLASVPVLAWFDFVAFFFCIVLAFASFIAALRQAIAARRTLFGPLLIFLSVLGLIAAPVIVFAIFMGMAALVG